LPGVPCFNTSSVILFLEFPYSIVDRLGHAVNCFLTPSLELFPAPLARCFQLLQMLLGLFPLPQQFIYRFVVVGLHGAGGRDHLGLQLVKLLIQVVELAGQLGEV
jgi:hypothetical protein